MNLKQRFSIIFSSLFSLLLAAVMLVVYYLFANFRTAEFVERLAEKAEATARLLITVKEIDYQTQKTIDRNSASKLYKENTEIFNEHKQLIYDTEHAIDINWQPSDFDQIVEKKRFFEKKGPYDVVGLAYTYNKHFYYVFISAEDNYGVSKLEYLKYLLLGAFISGTILVWLISFRLSKKSLQPLDDFRRQIQNITDHNLKVRLSVSETKNKDEVNALAKSFNQMMERIDRAYNRQREFTGNASHELRTPVARMAVQIENLIQSSIVPTAVQDQLAEISQDVFQLSEIITSLVALADITRREHDLSFENIRLDEVVFAATAQITKNYPDFLFRFDVENNSGRETDFEIHGDETLLKIVLTNLFKNAYLYSDNHLLECLIIQHKNGLQLQLTNTGQVPDVENTRILFDAFYRGNNSKATAGSGIGLSIVKRVLDYHGAKITYHLIDDQTNQIDIFFPV